MAECSESTGRSLTPFFFASAVTSAPAQTRVSLLARAMVFPASMAARVGSSPAMPTTEVSTVSADGRVTASSSASLPPRTRTEVSAIRTARSWAAASSERTTSLGPTARACSSIILTLLWAVNASTDNPRAAITSSDCRPMEPVEPKIVSRCVTAHASLLTHAGNCTAGSARHKISISGAQKITLSKRSRTPP